MGPPMSPNVGGGLMPHPRPQHGQHPPRGPPGPSLAPRGTQAALKAEQDLKVCLHTNTHAQLIICTCFSKVTFRELCVFNPPTPSLCRRSSALKCSSPLINSSQNSSSSSNSRPRKPAKCQGSTREENLLTTALPQTTRLGAIAQNLTNPPSPQPSPYGLAPLNHRPSSQKRASKELPTLFR